MTVQLCLISLIVQLAIIAQQEREFQYLALKVNSQIQQRTQNLQTVGIVHLAGTALVQEILHQQTNVLLIFTAPVAKERQHQENTSVHQVTSAKLEQNYQSDVKMVPSKMSLAKALARHVQMVFIVMLPMQLL